MPRSRCSWLSPAASAEQWLGSSPRQCRCPIHRPASASDEGCLRHCGAGPHGSRRWRTLHAGQGPRWRRPQRSPPSRRPGRVRLPSPSVRVAHSSRPPGHEPRAGAHRLRRRLATKPAETAGAHSGVSPQMVYRYVACARSAPLPWARARSSRLIRGGPVRSRAAPTFAGAALLHDGARGRSPHFCEGPLFREQVLVLPRPPRGGVFVDSGTRRSAPRSLLTARGVPPRIPESTPMEA